MLPDLRFLIGAMLATAVLGVCAFGLVTAGRLAHQAKVGPLEASRVLAFAAPPDRHQFYHPDGSRPLTVDRKDAADAKALLERFAPAPFGEDNTAIRPHDPQTEQAPAPLPEASEPAQTTAAVATEVGSGETGAVQTGALEIDTADTGAVTSKSADPDTTETGGAETNRVETRNVETNNVELDNAEARDLAPAPTETADEAAAASPPLVVGEGERLASLPMTTADQEPVPVETSAPQPQTSAAAGDVNETIPLPRPRAAGTQERPGKARARTRRVARQPAAGQPAIPTGFPFDLTTAITDTTSRNWPWDSN